MKKVVAICLVSLAVSAGAGTFETEDLFSITLPHGWVRMPDDVLVSYAEAKNEVYDYGFQLSDAEKWLAYPCILVQANYDGRYSTGDLERFAEDSGGNIADYDAGKALFTEVLVQDGIKVLVGRQLTEYGFIELKGFAPEEAFDEYEGVFREAFSKLKIDELIQYKPQITDNAPVVGNINLGKAVIVCVQAALIGGVLWLVYSLIKRTVTRSCKRA